MKIFIYTLEDSKGNIRYVGKSKDIKRRFREHIKNYEKSNSYKNNWIKSLLNMGKYPVISIIDEVEYEDSAFFEMFWISQFQSWGFNLTNLTIGGEGTIGYRFTDEQKQKMRKPKSDEHKIKISNSQKGRKLDDDWKKSIRDGCLKSKKMLEVNRRIGKEKEIEVYQYDKFNLLIKKFISIKEASEKTGIKHISECINGKRKDSAGYIWSKKILEEKNFILRDLKKKINNEAIKVNFKKIEDLVCTYFNVSKEEIRATSTRKNIPKIYLTYLLYNLIDNISLSMIDDYLGSTGSKFRIKYKYDNKTLVEMANRIINNEE
jgi:group I intron endonuclease